MKRSSVFYWLLGIMVVAIVVTAGFYFDNAVHDFIAQHRNREVFNFMYNVTRFGDWPAHVAVGLILAGVAWRLGNKKWTRIFLSMLIALALAGVIGTIIKRGIPRARPSVKSELRWGGPRFSTHHHAFPSGHVAASTAFFGVLFFARRRRIALACLPIPVLIGFSRMYVAAHYLSDVVCAAILGILCALLVTRVLLPRNEHRTSNIEHQTSNSRRG
ncbi:MAG TPA: phosphatase PAP2 family protein [Candidatus Baltobacteraceae bacterium]|nr:phosphatase PAP2 family protein [Candidatus Baltobacteraceae bacterium]